MNILLTILLVFYFIVLYKLILAFNLLFSKLITFQFELKKLANLLESEHLDVVEKLFVTPYEFPTLATLLEIQEIEIMISHDVSQLLFLIYLLLFILLALYILVFNFEE